MRPGRDQYELLLTQSSLDCALGVLLCGRPTFETCNDIMDSELDPGAEDGSLPFDHFALVCLNVWRLLVFAVLRTVVALWDYTFPCSRTKSNRTLSLRSDYP
jgi:hypothetical protein